MPSRMRADPRRLTVRFDHAAHVSTQHYARLVNKCVTGIGLRHEDYGSHSLRRKKVSLISKHTGNPRVVQILLGHTRIESTIRHLGIDAGNVLVHAGGIDNWASAASGIRSGSLPICRTTSRPSLRWLSLSWVAKQSNLSSPPFALPVASARVVGLSFSPRAKAGRPITVDRGGCPRPARLHHPICAISRLILFVWQEG